MRKNTRKQIRLTEELLDYINDHVDNASQFIREAVREKVEAGKKATAYVEKELKKANLIIETRKKERYGRYLSYVYYSPDHKDFEGIIRNGKMLNEELVKNGLAVKYGE